MTIRVLGLASGMTSLEDHRHAIAALLAPAGSMASRGGLFPGGGGDLVAVSAMQSKVTPFYAWIDGGAALQAGYDFTSDADKTLTFPDGEPAVSRIDRVIAVVHHNSYDASGSTLGDIEVLKGQASGAANALPPSCELLWEVSVPAGASAGNGGINFATRRTDKRRTTTAAGGLLPVLNQAERDAIVAPYDGFGVWRRDQTWIEVYDGAAWRISGTARVAIPADLTTYITSPYTGQSAYVTTGGYGYRYNGTKWLRDPVRVRPTIKAQFVNTTVPADVPGMSIPLDAGGVYPLDAMIKVGGLQNIGCTLFLQLPAGATFDGHVVGWRDDTGAYQPSLINSGSGQVQLGLVGYGYNGGSNFSPVLVRGTITVGATAGSATLRAAQRVANGSAASTVELPSSMELQQSA